MPKRTTSEIRVQAGQLLIMGFAASQPTPRLRQLIERLRPGGVVLFARNIQDARQTWELLRECRRLSATPPFLGVDMEGGTVDRFRRLLGPSPAAAEVFASGDRQLFRKHGRIIGEAVRGL